MSLATFDDTMLDLTLEFDDREIYNDIRSQVDVTVITPGAETWESVEVTDTAIGFYSDTISDGQHADVTLYTRRLSYYALAWELPTADVSYTVAGGYTGVGGYVESGVYHTTIDGVVTASNTRSATVRITNNTGYTIRVLSVKCDYSYNDYEKMVGNPTTGTQTLTVRATDATSIALYGRRVMNLTWPLGQTQEQTEGLAAAYLARYKDPVIRVKMTIIGKTDALIEEIYTRDISDLITVINTSLGLNADFYINNINLYHDPFGLPIVEWTLEYQRTNETYTLFTLDTSELDGTHVLAY